MSQVGLFGGTFNPPHFGHINLALQLQEMHGLDEVWFVPALSPFRMNETLPEPHHRLNMLSLALADIPIFKVCETELHRPGPSYTVDTVKEILAGFPEHKFSLLLGEDTALRLESWKESLTIVRALPLLIGLRPHSHLLEHLPVSEFPEIIVSIQKGLTTIRQMEISATEIRQRLKNRLYCGHLMPWKTLDYIYENQLYSSF